MKFNKHFDLDGQHAFLGASTHSWLNWTDEQLAERWHARQAAKRGTELHALAKQLIDMKVNLPRSKKTLNMYVNDGIGFNMDTEVVLKYSDVCFGTADSISFKNNVLRIHDLKTGVTKTYMEQLMIYAALFCLEYGVAPSSIKIILRIYQNDEITEIEANPNDIMIIINKMIKSTKLLLEIKEQEG